MVPLILVLISAYIPQSLAQWDASRFAWYSSDAGSDFQSAVPIGNGRLGALVYGTEDEKISLNENSVWSGPWKNRANPNSLSALDDIRSKLVSGDMTAAGESVLQNSESVANPLRFVPCLIKLKCLGFPIHRANTIH